MKPLSWNEGLDEVCSNFQLDISCLVDAELDESAAGRAMIHMEACSCCREFFEDTRTHLRLHKDMADPDRLFARFAMLTGSNALAQVEGIDLAHRLASVFYQLGKAYVLVGVDAGYRERVFEAAVPIETTQTRGRGFVDGVLLNGKDKQVANQLDWQRARAMLNGRLERIESPTEKGRRLLEEAIAIDPSHEEAQLYMAFLHGHEGRRVTAAEEFLQVFKTAIHEGNRAHAAVQLGRLYFSERAYAKAIACWRWITIHGIEARDGRFFFVRFNLGMAYAMTENRGRALHYFRQLLDRHPQRVREVADLFARSPKLREAIDAQPGFPEELLRTCPELFMLSTTAAADPKEAGRGHRDPGAGWSSGAHAG